MPVAPLKQLNITVRHFVIPVLRWSAAKLAFYEI